MYLGYYAMNFSRSRIVSLLDNFSLASIVEKIERKTEPRTRKQWLLNFNHKLQPTKLYKLYSSTAVK